MKAATFGVLALCLVLANASTSFINPIEDGIGSLEDYADIANKKAEELNKEIEILYDEKIVQPLERIDASAYEIEERKQESEVCVARQEAEIEQVLQNAITAFDACAETATQSGSSLGWSITKITLQLGWDTYKLVQDYKKCKNYKSTFWKAMCYTQASIKTIEITYKTEQAIVDLTRTKEETVPQIVGELDSCSVAAEQAAMTQLEEINKNIDSCVAGH